MISVVHLKPNLIKNYFKHLLYRNIKVLIGYKRKYSVTIRMPVWVKSILVFKLNSLWKYILIFREMTGAITNL